MVLGDDISVPTGAQLAATAGAANREAGVHGRGHQVHPPAPVRNRRVLARRPWRRHMNFCDSPLYSPVRRLTHAGPIRAERAMEIVNAYVVAFFQAQLNDKVEPTLNVSRSPYPEVEIELFPGSKP